MAAVRACRRGKCENEKMPIYEFECSACSERFDRLQKLNDPDPDACPRCGAAKVRRRVTAPSFRLAGSGWYETDFKKGAEKKRNLAEQAEPAKAQAKPDEKKTATSGSAAEPSKKPTEAKPSKPAAAADS